MGAVNYVRVNDGDDLVISAATWNALVDMLKYYRGSTNKPDPATKASPYAANVVLVKNTTSTSIDRFQAIAIGSSLADAATNLDEYKSRIIFNGGSPNSGHWASYSMRFRLLPSAVQSSSVSFAVESMSLTFMTNTLTHLESFRIQDQQALHKSSKSLAASAVQRMSVNSGQPFA